MLIAIDAGHGGKDPGAVGPTGLQEADVTLKIANKLESILKASNVDIVQTRTTDSYLSLTERCNIANSSKADYFVSIHINSYNASAHGTETYFYKVNGKSDVLAKAVQENLVTAINLTNRGVKQASFTVLVKTNMPAILVEVAFISNPAEETLLQSEEFILKAAQGIANGIIAHVGIPAARHWGEGAIQELMDLGLITETKEPNSFVTWAEFATVLLRAIDMVEND